MHARPSSVAGADHSQLDFAVLERRRLEEREGHAQRVEESPTLPLPIFYLDGLLTALFPEDDSKTCRPEVTRFEIVLIFDYYPHICQRTI